MHERYKADNMVLRDVAHVFYTTQLQQSVVRVTGLSPGVTLRPFSSERLSAVTAKLDAGSIVINL